MRREDVAPLLFRAADRLPEPDLADAAWAEGVAVRRRRRRSILIGLIAAVVVALITVIGIGISSGKSADVVPPTEPPTNPPDYIAPAGQIAGLDFWLAPPPGSERFLDRLETPLGDRLELPEKVRPLAKHLLDQVAAVVLERNGGVYRPLLLGSDSSWSIAEVQLVSVAGHAPLSPGAVSPDGRVVAFPQPGQLVTVDASTAEVNHYALPGQDLRSVSWLENEQHILVSGPDIAYRVLVGEGGDGEKPVVLVRGSPDPEAVTAPFRMQNGSMERYQVTGDWAEDSALVLPVQSWVGQTFSSEGAAARLFIAHKLTQVPTKWSQPQVVAAISTLRALPSRLLVLGEPLTGPPRTPSGPADQAFVREPGCCAVLGWYDEGTVLLQVRGWVLAWSLDSGRVRRVTELAVDGLALGPDLRS
ncbi:hypothetical protein AB0E69_28895 [Kribbella sp. NPDC026611]|uniref:hypothetical protein n=1 Tax=Kribbella sp. NPDC026611 TaxID=3154911 RepID=UPI0034080C5C